MILVPTGLHTCGYKWGYKSPNMGYKYSYPTYNPTYNYKSPNMGYSYSYPTYNPTYNYP